MTESANPQPQATPYSGPPGAGQLAAPLAPPPPPAPPAEPETPHPDETFAPGELALYDYEHPADKPGKTRTQLVMVSHTDDTHVHGLVLGELKDVASFVKGQLHRGNQAAATG